jgi:predicted DNA-binding transcriptional regulator YafY
VIGWDEVLCDISVVKLHLISLCDMLADKFVIYKYYNIHDYIDEYGFKKDNDWQHIKLKINNNLLMNFKERVYGKNLKITRTRGKTSTVDLDMVNKKDILNLVLEFGKDVVVLEPSWLIDELISYQEYILKTYKK